MSTERRILCCLAIFFCFIVSSQIANADAGEDAADQNRPVKDKWAVIIGVSKFADKQIPQLKYPSKDAKDFCNFLIGKENFAKDHVLLLTDEQATKVKILEAFGDGWLPQRVMKDDLVVVFISTHGSPADKAGENFIIAYDSDPSHPYATGIRLQDLSRELTNRTGCDRLVLLLDACHSGAAVTESKGITRAPSNFNLESIAGSGQLVISSSKSDQVSWESKRYPNGVFTAQLMQALEKSGKEAPLEDAFRQLQSGVETEVRFDRLTDQTPIMLNRWKGQKLALGLTPIAPRVIPPDLPAEPETQTANANPQASSQPPVSTAAQKVAALPARQPQRSIAPPPPPAAQPRIQAATQNSGRSTSQGLPIIMSSNWTDPQGDVTLERGTRVINADELQGLSKEQITLLYNEAYARHGRGFATPYIRNYFLAQSWYREDPDYHWRPDDQKVRARQGKTDDPLVINATRTPKQWTNMQVLKRLMDSK